MAQWSRTLRWLGVLLAAFLLSACGSTDPKDPTGGVSPEKLYADAKDDLNAGRWSDAIKQLEKIEARFPFGRWAQQAQIDIAFAHYKNGDRALALAETDRFLKQYPSHPALDYVYYLRGLINFNEQQGLIARWGRQDLSERDLQAAREAFDAFKEVVIRFPESKYAADSEGRMRYLVNSMASGEVHIARYYFRRGAYIAAANRAQGAIRQYGQAPAIEEALYIVMASYDKLGLKELRDDTERVLKLNFPNSIYLSANPPSQEASWWQIWR